MSHSLYESAQPTCEPILWYTQPHGPKSSYESGHTLQVESAHGLKHPTKWVTLWVQSVPIKSLDSPRSDHVTSHEELHGIECTTWHSMLICSRQPNSPHSINETLGLLHSINTQRHTTFGDPHENTHSDTLSNSWTTLVYSI